MYAESMRKTFEECLFSVDEIYVVPPANTTLVCISRHAANTYVSIEDLGMGSRWEHRKDSARGFGCFTADARDYAKLLWKRLQEPDADSVMAL